MPPNPSTTPPDPIPYHRIPHHTSRSQTTPPDPTPSPPDPTTPLGLPPQIPHPGSPRPARRFGPPSSLTWLHMSIGLWNTPMTNPVVARREVTGTPGSRSSEKSRGVMSASPTLRTARSRAGWQERGKSSNNLVKRGRAPTREISTTKRRRTYFAPISAWGGPRCVDESTRTWGGDGRVMGSGGDRGGEWRRVEESGGDWRRLGDTWGGLYLSDIQT